MDLKARITKPIIAAQSHPKYVVLGLTGLLIFNLLSFILLIINAGASNNLVIPTFLLIFLWPVVLVLFGIGRLRRGTSTDEAEMKKRREMTLRIFAIAALFLLVILIISWRYYTEKYFIRTFTVNLIIAVLIVSGLLVTIVWHWTKYSDNKLSVSINKAPLHYLFSAITLVITVISYIVYSDIDSQLITIESRINSDRFNLDTSELIEVRSFLSATKAVFQSAAWIGMFASLGTAVLGYLRPSGMATVLNDEVKNNALDNIPAGVDLITDNKQVELTHKPFNPDSLELLLSSIELNNTKLEKLLQQPAISSHPLISSEVVAGKVELIRGRLIVELKELTKRGNLNLTIGILTTLGAASALYWGLIATQPQPDQTGTPGLLRHYLPRISFAVFIEVFSFFFLRLYKSSLEDIKYYHNELTTLDSRLLALEIAAAAKMSEALTPILLGLLNTDRNFILKSGESTVELEKIKTEQQYMRALIDSISTKIPDLGTARKDSNKG